jgi:hypothetical protein
MKARPQAVKRPEIHHPPRPSASPAIFRAMPIRLSGPAAALALLLIVLTATPATAQVELQVFGGSALNLRTPITISQAGHPDLSFTARWGTRPTRPTWYYAWRVGLWNANRGWRLDHTHHKLYLDNPPPEVQAFRITNGFNIVTVSRAFRRNALTWSLGAGPVITYPISTVREKKFDHDNGFNGYHLSGGSLMAMATREFPLTGGLVLSLDARTSLSWVRVPIEDGHARLPNAALHLHAGLGYVSGRSR